MEDLIRCNTTRVVSRDQTHQDIVDDRDHINTKGDQQVQVDYQLQYDRANPNMCTSSTLPMLGKWMQA